MKSVAKYVLFAVLCMIVLSMVLGTLHLIVMFVQKLLSPDPYYLVISIEDLYVLFTIMLIIFVGYELFKSLLLVIHHDSIPVRSILKITAIAICNEIITLEMHKVSFQQMAGIALLIVSTGAAFYMFNKDNLHQDE
ncbi:MAG: phosphate-starvation-inducible PsiE family protein [Chitinophagales bacterium]|nr:phosphate-starvation-inducible PsiE family protein [Chitinophagales bacterium]